MSRQHRSSHSGPEQLSLFEVSTDPAIPESAPAPPSVVEPAVRISRRARRLALHVGYDGSAELVVPQGTPERDVRQFLDSHRDWLVQARDAQLERYGAFDRSRPEALMLPAVGEQWRLERRELPGRRLAARLRPGTAPTEVVMRHEGDEGVAESPRSGPCTAFLLG